MRRHRLQQIAWIVATILVAGCRPAQDVRVSGSVHCDSLLAAIGSSDGDPNTGQTTYDAHSSIDTAPDRLTAGKGCILARWVGQFDSARGRLPYTLEELPNLDTLHVIEMPGSGWMHDGWGGRFGYTQADGSAMIYSLGPDGRDSTGDELVFTWAR